MLYRTNLLCLAGGFLAGSLGLLLSDSIVTPAAAAQEGGASNTQKPNILFILGDDIGWMQPSIYHRGLMVCVAKTRPDAKSTACDRGRRAVTSC